ncbi:hypothetical protein WJX74_002535 [Apatococcus lobatus]|uniref:Uncharacterized protein n=2 Tax=Apatococcus TaxID=904362 RepID=A0AAW1TE70_9CHLO
MVTTRSAMKAAAPASQEEPSTDLRSRITSSRSTCDTPGPRGVLFEVDTNSNTPAGKAFHDTPYPKQASKKTIRFEYFPHEKIASAAKPPGQEFCSPLVQEKPSSTSPAAATPAKNLEPSDDASKPTPKAKPAFINPDAGMKAETTPSAPEALLERQLMLAVDSKDTGDAGDVEQQDNALKMPAVPRAAAQEFQPAAGLAEMPTSMLTEQSPTNDVEETITDSGERQEADAAAEHVQATDEELVMEGVNMDAETQPGKSLAESAAEPALIHDVPAHAATSELTQQNASGPDKPQTGVVPELHGIQSPVMDILEQAKSIPDPQGAGSQSFKVLMEALNVASAKAAQAAGDHTVPTIPTPEKIVEITQFDPETAKEIHSVMATNTASPLQSMAMLDHNRLSMFQKQPQLPEEKAKVVPLSTMAEAPTAQTPAKAAGPAVTEEGSPMATKATPSHPSAVNEDEDMQSCNEESASPLAEHQMSVASAKSTPGRWILEGAPAPTPPHLQFLGGEQQIRSEVRVPTAIQTGTWDMRTPMRDQDIETDIEESVLQADDQTDVEDDACFDPEAAQGDSGTVLPGGHELLEAMDQLKIETGRSLLRGVPDARGQHLRFMDDGEAVQSPGNRNATVLRGMPAPAGKYIKFEVA